MADFTQLSRMARLFARLSPGLDVKPLLAELKERVAEELDYRLEADAQRGFAAAYADDDMIAIGRVVASAPKVIVTEWLEGTQLSSIIATGTTARARQRRLPAGPAALLGPRAGPAAARRPAPGQLPDAAPTGGSASSTSAPSPGCPRAPRRPSAG